MKKYAIKIDVTKKEVTLLEVGKTVGSETLYKEIECDYFAMYSQSFLGIRANVWYDDKGIDKENGFWFPSYHQAVMDNALLCDANSKGDSVGYKKEIAEKILSNIQNTIQWV